MPIKADSILLWKRREQECRTLASRLTVPEARSRVLTIADGYREMAEQATQALAAESDEEAR